jgi:LPS-assembly lipoprotein
MSWSEARADRRAWLAGAAVLALGGCGFQRQQTPVLRFASIALTGFGPDSALRAELARELSAQVRVLPHPAQAQVVLQALEEARERSVVAITAAAQVRELQLRVRLSFRADTPAGRELIPRAELLLARDMSFSESTALAKEQEEAELVRAMQADIVRQVLRQLAALNP